MEALMSAQLEMACPECRETRMMSTRDKNILTAKTGVACGGGHTYQRADGFFNWLLSEDGHGSALVLADTALEGNVTYQGDAELEVRLPYSLKGADIVAWPTSQWTALGGGIAYSFVWRRRAFITLKASRRTRGEVPAARFQVYGARRASRVPGWRQALGEAIIAFQEGRTNGSILLANIAVETKYSSLTDRRLRKRGMSDKLIADWHGRLPFEYRLREKFAKAFKLPPLSDAPFWADWLKKARASRNPLAHNWRFERGSKSIASESDARQAILLHMKAILHLDPRSFDWLMNLDAKAVSD
jgi:hypothetical protein